MKLRTKYILFVVILHGIAGVLSFFILAENKPLFLVAEAVILLSIFLSWQLYRQLIQPLKLLMQGTDAIRDRDFNVKFLRTGRYEMDELIKVYNQMMDALREERTKQEEQHFFLEKLIHTSPTGILILDYDDRIQQINPKALQLLWEGDGWQEGARRAAGGEPAGAGSEPGGEMESAANREVLGSSIREWAHPILQQISQLQSGESKTLTFNGALTYKVQKSHFIDRGFPRHFVLIEELTAEILEAEKKTYGKVIRMMAHEVNNTIGPVNSILQSTLQAQQNSELLTQALRVAMDRNNNLNLFMRNFADLVRIPLPVKTSIGLLRLLENTLELMRRRAGEKKIRFQLDAAGGDLPIRADLQQMEQVLINIIKNSMEAIEEEGCITIITAHHPKKLIIRDTGRGIPAELEDQLFSPFFSTKKDGQGVGLTIIREILLNHGFPFSLRTLAPGTTEFVIHF